MQEIDEKQLNHLATELLQDLKPTRFVSFSAAEKHEKLALSEEYLLPGSRVSRPLRGRIADAVAQLTTPVPLSIDVIDKAREIVSAWDGAPF